MREGDMDAQPGSGKKISRSAALAIAIAFAGAVAVGVWLIADDAGLTMGEVAASGLIGAAIGLVAAVILILLAMSRFRALFYRMRTPSVLLLGGLGLWAWLLLGPTILIGLVVGLTATVYFLIVLAWVFDPWQTRQRDQQDR
jgi:hypothetical protein